MSHTRILYRQFLFRLMDVEFLAAGARGDASQLFGQFASMLIFVSFVGAYAGLIAGSMPRSRENTWFMERILIEVTMLVVGIFALLSWDSTFPDRRDVQVLSPLPVRGSAIFVAKVAAAASSLGLTVLALHCLAGFTWPGALTPKGAGFVPRLRFMAAYWITLPAAGAFLYCSMLGLQGAVALLPRAWFLRISSFLQIGAFALFLGVIFLQPSFLTAKALAAPENQRALASLPDYWFMGLFSKISGADPSAAIDRLAARALAGLAIAVLMTLVAFVLSWLRTMRKIAEEPDILPGSRGGLWLPRFGARPHTALVHFTIRALARSRQHRMNLAFYLGVGFAMIAVMKAPMPSILLLLCLAVVGTRMAFSRPLDLRANWLFKTLPMSGAATARTAARRALLALTLLPGLLGAAVWFLRTWPTAEAAKHLFLVALFGMLLIEAWLITFRKIPFACSYLPGKSRFHLIFAGTIQILPLALLKLVEWEQQIASAWLTYIATAAGLAAAIVISRKLPSQPEEILYEDFASDDIIELNLQS
ncbi:MAG TPA: hypothetical protein VHA14_08065 [Bryobacteraceae bacterium]|nr:hypothetical protein [Bryobacteraceae bacterium]